VCSNVSRIVEDRRAGVNLPSRLPGGPVDVKSTAVTICTTICGRSDGINNKHQEWRRPCTRTTKHDRLTARRRREKVTTRHEIRDARSCTHDGSNTNRVTARRRREKRFADKVPRLDAYAYAKNARQQLRNTADRQPVTQFAITGHANSLIARTSSPVVMRSITNH